MGDDDRTPPRPHPAAVAVFNGVKPYVGAVGVVGLISTPAEVAVAVARRLRRRSGVSTGPGLASLINASIAMVATHYVRQPARWSRLKDQPVPPVPTFVGLAYVALSPALAARWSRGVILPGRTPLLAALVSPTGLLQILIMAVTIVRARRARARAIEFGEVAVPEGG